MDCLTIGKRSLYRFISDEAKTNMYVLTENSRALVVDPHLSDDAIIFLKQQGIVECTLLLTHEHSDHTCGIPEFEKYFTLNVICQQACAESIATPDNGQLSLTVAMFSIQDSKNGTRTVESFLEKYQAFEYQADITFKSTFEWIWQQEKFVFTATPGHSRGGCCICWHDTAIFTGDSLMVSIPVITRFPGGNTRDYETKTLPFLRTLDQNLVALPGHGEIFRLGDAVERAV